MKKLRFVSSGTFLFIFLSSCAAGNFLKRPEDTNLAFWITQKVETEDFKDCTLLPGMFGGDMYLDSKYEALEGDMPSVPDIHVVYTVTKYPDYSSPDLYVTAISITDPTIYVYGLTINASDAQIEERMNELNYKNTEYGSRKWEKNNCKINFLEGRIYMSAHVTNHNNIFF